MGQEEVPGHVEAGGDGRAEQEGGGLEQGGAEAASINLRKNLDGTAQAEEEQEEAVGRPTPKAPRPAPDSGPGRLESGARTANGPVLPCSRAISLQTLRASAPADRSSSSCKSREMLSQNGRSRNLRNSRWCSAS